MGGAGEAGDQAAADGAFEELVVIGRRILLVGGIGFLLLFCFIRGGGEKSRLREAFVFGEERVLGGAGFRGAAPGCRFGWLV